jgi:rRNA-processing protein FCF1
MPKAAVDTNILIDYAKGIEKVIDCIDILKEKKFELWVPPTVVQELADICVEEDAVASDALTALQRLSEWEFIPFDCVPVGHGIVEEVASKIRRQGLIPYEEIHDSQVLVESAILGADILVTSDKHLTEAPPEFIKRVLTDHDLNGTTIISP